MEIDGSETCRAGSDNGTIAMLEEQLLGPVFVAVQLHQLQRRLQEGLLFVCLLFIRSICYFGYL